MELYRCARTGLLQHAGLRFREQRLHRSGEPHPLVLRHDRDRGCLRRGSSDCRPAVRRWPVHRPVRSFARARPRRFFATPEDVANLRCIAEAAHGAGKIWEAAVGNLNYQAEALKHDPAFVTAADDLSALYAGFRTLLA